MVESNREGRECSTLSPFFILGASCLDRPNFSRALAGVLILLAVIPCLHAADRSKNLPPQYRHWLNQEVNYIIDSQEKKQFLTLTTDAQRDSFIDAFWRIRNPDPNSDINTYKQEHYRRLAYANEHYGSIAAHDGWRTDQGRMYIILGPHKAGHDLPAGAQCASHGGLVLRVSQPRPAALFLHTFLQAQHRRAVHALLPSQDGPARLVSSLEALNDQTRSLKILRKSLGDEVAKMSLTLLPDESVNLDDGFAPSLNSDLILSTIAGLPDNPITQEQLNLNRGREHVTMSVLTGEGDLTLGYDVIRDEEGRETVSYLLATAQPDARLIGRRDDEHRRSTTFRFAPPSSQTGKSAYDQEDRLTANLTEPQIEVVKQKRFGAEGRVPLAPGTYILEATLTNNVNHIAQKKRTLIAVPR